MSFFDTAPVVMRNAVFVAAPRRRVFDAIAEDPAGWGRWFPGFNGAGRYETSPPHGVGSVRTVRAFGTRYRETVLVWDDGERWAFRVDEMGGVPFAKAFAEDYRLRDEGNGTRLEWTAAMRPAAAMRAATPLMPAGFRLVAKRVGAGLSRVVGGS